MAGRSDGVGGLTPGARGVPAEGVRRAAARVKLGYGVGVTVGTVQPGSEK